MEFGTFRKIKRETKIKMCRKKPVNIYKLKDQDYVSYMLLFLSKGVRVLSKELYSELPTKSFVWLYIGMDRDKLLIIIN